VFTTYLSFYLVFVVLVSLVVSLLVLWLKLPSPRLIIALLIFFILSPLIFGYFYLMYFNSLPEATVPDVVGLTLAEAKEKLEAAELQARLAGTVYELKYTEGAVVSQRPEAGRRVKAGRVVNLMVSSGKRKVTVPNLMGRTLIQADAILGAAELRVGEVKFDHNPSVEEGTILAQEPLSGEETEMGGTVDLLVATTLEVITEENTGEVE